MPSDTGLQMLVWGTYGPNGNTYYSGTDPANRAYDLAVQTSQLAFATEHPYAQTISDRMFTAAGMTLEEQAAYNDYTRPGALRDASAVRSVLDAGKARIESWKDAIDLNVEAARDAVKMTASDLFGLSVDSVMRFVILTLGIILLSIAAYSILIPESARGEIASGAVKAAVLA